MKLKVGRLSRNWSRQAQVGHFTANAVDPVQSSSYDRALAYKRLDDSLNILNIVADITVDVVVESSDLLEDRGDNPFDPIRRFAARDSAVGFDPRDKFHLTCQVLAVSGRSCWYACEACRASLE